MVESTAENKTGERGREFVHWLVKGLSKQEGNERGGEIINRVIEIKTLYDEREEGMREVGDWAIEFIREY